MQQEDILRILSAATVTQGLEPADLAALLQHATVETVPQGWTVLAEGQRGEALYVVLKGQLKGSQARYVPKLSLRYYTPNCLGSTGGKLGVYVG